MIYAIVPILLTACLSTSACTVHRHTPAVKSVTVLDREHGRRDILVVNTRPGADRRCWKHRAHWHCRAR